jgi:hypothetical protein
VQKQLRRFVTPHSVSASAVSKQAALKRPQDQ